MDTYTSSGSFVLWYTSGCPIDFLNWAGKGILYAMFFRMDSFGRGIVILAGPYSYLLLQLK